MDTSELEQIIVSFDTEKEPDLTIVCQQKRYYVHKAFVRARSEFFDGACKNPFKESESGVIDLSEDDPEAVEHMINYLYYLEYRPPSHTSLRGVPIRPIPPRPATETRLRADAGHKKRDLDAVEDPLLATAASNISRPYPYASTTIQDPAGSLTPPASATIQTRELPWSRSAADSYVRDEELVDAFDTMSIPEQEPDYAHASLMDHAKVYAIAEQYGILGLKGLAKKKFAAQVEHHHGSSEFAECLQEIYQTTPHTDRGLRDIILSAFRKHPELIRRQDIENSVRLTADLAWDLCMMGLGLPV